MSSWVNVLDTKQQHMSIRLSALKTKKQQKNSIHDKQNRIHSDDKVWWGRLCQSGLKTGFTMDTFHLWFNVHQKIA